jgi:hypothetical protein
LEAQAMSIETRQQIEDEMKEVSPKFVIDCMEDISRIGQKLADEAIMLKNQVDDLKQTVIAIQKNVGGLAKRFHELVEKYQD